MSATTPSKSERGGDPSGGQIDKRKFRPVPVLIFGGLIFALAWLSWTLFFAPLA